MLTLIGATTENPYFEVNAALLSRCQVYQLEPLCRGRAGDDRPPRSRRARRERLRRPRRPDRAQGRRRRAHGLNILELAWQTAGAAGEELGEAHVEDAARKRPLVYDRAGDQHYDFASAFIKSMRGSDPDAAVYYLAAMLEGGETRFVARRMVILASEDIGNADPNALVVAVAAANAVEHGAARGTAQPRAGRDLPRAGAEVERRHDSPPQRLGETSASGATSGRRKPFAAPVIRASDRWAMGRATYPHDDPAGFDMSYLPDELKGRKYYRPADPE